MTSLWGEPVGLGPTGSIWTVITYRQPDPPLQGSAKQANSTAHSEPPVPPAPPVARTS